MSNKLPSYFTFFIGGLLNGFSFFSSILIPFSILGHYLLIKGLFSKNRKFNPLLSGWLFGVGFFLTSMHWIVNPFLIYEEHKTLAPFVLIIFPSLMGLFFIIPCILIKKFINFQKIYDFFLTKVFLISFFFFYIWIFKIKYLWGITF